MFKKLYNHIVDTRDRQRICIALSKGGAMMHARNIDLTQPLTWEFSGFSQNGEDGIIDVLRSQLINSNRYCIEIGTSDGVENNTAWLIVAEKFNGLMIEGNLKSVERARRNITSHSIGAECINMFVTKESAKELREISSYYNPDVFSLDIDGNDYHIAKSVFEAGFLPKIFVVEYNSVYGPDRSLTIPYKKDFIFTEAHPTALYYGVSHAGWHKFFTEHGYMFVTSNSHGVNSFYINPDYFKKQFVENIIPHGFSENLYQKLKFKANSETQFELIQNQTFITI